jgi:hypothetical protein
VVVSVTYRIQGPAYSALRSALIPLLFLDKVALSSCDVTNEIHNFPCNLISAEIYHFKTSGIKTR